MRSGEAPRLPQPLDAFTMKAFLSRINRGLLKERDKDTTTNIHKEKIPQLSSLPEWPPRTTPTPASAFKPLPDLSTRPLPPIDEPTSSSTESSSANPTPNASTVPLPSAHTHDVHPLVSETGVSEPLTRAGNNSAGRSSHKTHSSSSGSAAHGDVQKKVAFKSPPQTPGPTERPLSPAETPTPVSAAPLKTTVSRFQANQSRDTRGSTSTATSSKTDVASTVKSVKATSTRATTSPYPRNYGDNASIHQSLRSTTPYSQMTNATSHILAAQSWSEGAQEDLVSNIGQRERTRQEVLWEIVASEERYVSHTLTLY